MVVMVLVGLVLVLVAFSGDGEKVKPLYIKGKNFL
jgi:hypothetical protein